MEKLTGKIVIKNVDPNKSILSIQVFHGAGKKPIISIPPGMTYTFNSISEYKPYQGSVSVHLNKKRIQLGGSELEPQPVTGTVGDEEQGEEQEAKDGDQGEGTISETPPPEKQKKSRKSKDTEPKVG